MKVLITGHKGFVGTEFYRKLYSQGHDITGVDIADSPARDARDFFRKSGTRFDLVIHLAAIVGGRLTIDGDPLSVATDLSIDAEMFNWAVRTKQKRVVYYSSSAAYPVQLQTGYGQRLHEDEIDFGENARGWLGAPDMTYGWAKLTGEYLAQFAEAEGVRTHVFRPFSGYGETQALDYPFPSFIERAARQADPFEIWGDGYQTRDFIHIDDIVDATLTAVEQDVEGPINLGWGRPTNFRELAEMVTLMARYFPKYEFHDDKPMGVSYRVSDNRKMLSFYEPKITLEEGVDRALRALEK